MSHVQPLFRRLFREIGAAITITSAKGPQTRAFSFDRETGFEPATPGPQPGRTSSMGCRAAL
jgi:hypothetical protein